jgi:hypothetical protein
MFKQHLYRQLMLTQAAMDRMPAALPSADFVFAVEMRLC